MGAWGLREDYQLTLLHGHKVYSICEKTQLLLTILVFTLAIIKTMAFRIQDRICTDQAFKS